MILLFTSMKGNHNYLNASFCQELDASSAETDSDFDMDEYIEKSGQT